VTDIYQITITTTNSEEFVGLMRRRQPEIVNGYVALSMENGDWMYFSPEDVRRFHFEPVASDEENDEEAALPEDGSTENDAPAEASE
jgi:hypothetical protein